MPVDENKKSEGVEGSSGDIWVDLAVQIAKQMPVKDLYEDALSGPLKELGSIATNVAKTIHLALFPIQVGAFAQDRLVRFIRTSLERVPEEDRKEPDAKVLISAVENMRGEQEGSKLDDMFSELLSRASDKRCQDPYHAVFAKLISQLTSEEAKLLVVLSETKSIPEAAFRPRQSNAGPVKADPIWENVGVEGDRLLMMSHLLGLGLIEVSEMRSQVPQYMRELGDARSVTRAINDLAKPQTVRKHVSISAFGRAFIKAVSPYTPASG